MMKLNKYILLSTVILLMVLGIQTGHAQPPPPPPPSGPPCWPPPCIPVNGGILYAVIAAVAFGAYTLFRSMKLRTAGK
jgi:hypothetical protein